MKIFVQYGLWGGVWSIEYGSGKSPMDERVNPDSQPWFNGFDVPTTIMDQYVIIVSGVIK